MDKDKQV